MELELGSNILQYGAGVAALIIALAAWTKIKASNSASNAEAGLYDNLTAENKRLSERLGETDRLIATLSDKVQEIESGCANERKESAAQIGKLQRRVDELVTAVAECQQQHMQREEEDEKGRQGIIERRKSGQPPRGRRMPR